MFTGIIQDVGAISKVERGGATARMWVSTKLDTKTFELGESVAVDGVCLTVVEIKGDSFRVDVSAESVARTTLKDADRGKRVNLERAMRASDRFGGHFVLGHVDGVGSVVGVNRDGSYLRMTVSPPADMAKYLVGKGSVAIDGVSLTVNAVDSGSFSLMLIPTTLSETTLAERKAGDKVNIETDILGKYIERFISARGAGGLTIEKLREQGWD